MGTKSNKGINTMKKLRLANTVSDKYLEVFMPLPQKYSIEIHGNNFELYCGGNFVYGNTCLKQIFVIYGRLLDGISYN